MRGSSGATFEYVDSGTIRKRGTGNGRVLAQGMWLERHPFKIFPTVYSTGELFGDDEYTMERLDNVPIEYVDVRTTMMSVIDTLSHQLWDKPANHSVMDPAAHAARLAPLEQFLTPQADIVLKALDASVRWDKVATGLTHGDPILDNVMLRDGKLVLIDPIPATSAIPDWICVDLGRIIQSAAGYEAVRYGLEAPEGFPIEVLNELICPSDEEYRASLYWAIVHTLRSMAYVDADVARRIQQVCLRRIVEAALWTV